MLAAVRSPRLPLTCTVLTLLLLPFEATASVFYMGGLAVSNLEALVVLTVAVWAGHRLMVRPAPTARLRPSPLLWPALAVVVVAFLSAWLSPELRPSALKMAGRLTGGVLFGIVVADLARRPAARRWMSGGLVAGATLAAILGLLEVVGFPWATAFLQLFRLDADQLGPAARLNATFDSANSMAMLLAPALCLALGLVSSSPRLPVSLFPCLLVSLFLTYSRGGIMAALVGIGVMLVLGGRRAWPVWRWPVGLAGVALVIVSLTLPTLRARLAFWDPRPLDGAVFHAAATLTGPGGAITHTPLSVTNTGRLTWRATPPNAWALGYHWLGGAGQTVLQWDTPTIPLPRDVAPGETITVSAPITLPAAGEYVLLWDLAQPSGAWLGAVAGLTTRTLVRSEGPDGSSLSTPFQAAAPTPPPDRLALWRAALAMTRERPWLGVGTGGFRHVYGRYLGLPEWDERIFANNLYLEVLADMGIVGLAVWLWLLAGVGWRAWRSSRPGDLGSVATLGALTAFLVHGLVDVALEVTAIYLLLATLLGLAAGKRTS